MSDIKKVQHRNFEGEVVSIKEDKTIHVLIKIIKMHPKYRKQYSVSKKYAVHDEHSRAKLGDVVTFVECRPISKTKKWTLVNIIK
ncbi:MAG: 30S ribosomal protein S17 [Candidatus Magasanikbacteria bacterium]